MRIQSAVFRRGRSKRWLKRVLTLGALMPVSLQARAETASIDRMSSGLMLESATSLSDVQPEPGAARVVEGQVRIESMQYLSEVPETPDLTNSKYLSARLSFSGAFESAPRFTYAGDFSAGTFFRRSQSQWVVREMNLGARLGSGAVVTVGRKKATWSELDERWQLGLWQPKFAIDTLRPEAQGLTGFFLDRSTEQAEVLVFASPIFIPNMGPDIREEGGGLVSDSRWYRQPSSQFAFNSRINSIAYKLDIPDAAKLVANPSVALMTRIGSMENGWRWRGAVGRKPMNDLVLRRSNFKSATQDRIDVTVVPDVAFHTVVSTDVGYATDTAQASISFLTDQPSSKRPDEGQAAQRLSGLQAYSAQFDWRLPDVLFSRSVQLQLGYLKINGGAITDVTADGSSDDFTLFDRRMIFTNAFSVGMEGQLASIAHRPLLTKLRYLYDRDQRGSLVNTEFQYYPERQWAVILGADVLGVEDETVDPSGFLNQYRANDRVYGGMTYVF